MNLKMLWAALLVLACSVRAFGASQTVPQVAIPMFPEFNISYATNLLDAASEKHAVIFRANKTGSIDRVAYRTGIVTTGATVDVRLETVSLTNGDPTGTLFGTNTNASSVIADTDDNVWKEATLTAAAAVTKGDLIAIVIENPAASFGNLNINRYTPVLTPSMPYTDLFTASWVKSAAYGVHAIRYNDGTYASVTGLVPYSTLTSVNVNSGSTPDEAALRFQVAVPTRVTGIWFGSTVGANFDVKLYDASDNLVVPALSIDADTDAGTATQYYYFSSTATLSANTTYRLAILPTSVTNIAVKYFEVNSASEMSATPGGTQFYWSQRTDAGAWTDTTTRVPLMGLLADQFSDGVSTGGTSSYGFAN